MVTLRLDEPIEIGHTAPRGLLIRLARLVNCLSIDGKVILSATSGKLLVSIVSPWCSVTSQTEPVPKKKIPYPCVDLNHVNDKQISAKKILVIQKIAF